MKVHLRLSALAGPLCVVAGLTIISRFNYLLFHSLAELFSIVVAAGIFIVAWNTRRIIENNYLLFLGLSYFFIGGLDLLHTLAYQGMGVFPGSGPNLATQFWVATRYLEAASLFAAPFFLRRSVRTGPVAGTYFILSGLIVAAIFSGRFFPDCFVEGAGLTTFKKVSEYIISAILVGAIMLLYRRRDHFEPPVLNLMSAAILCTIAAELSFTFYISVYGLSNLIGHFFKLLSFYLVYQALIVTGLTKPYDLLFRSLKKSEAALKEENRKLTILKEELSGKNLSLEKLMEQKNEFLGIAAHDIRSPLTVIRVYSEMLQEQLNRYRNPEASRLIAVIGKTADSMLKMVGNLLDITAIDAGKVTLDLQDTDFATLVEEKVRDARIMAGQKKIDISFSHDTELPPVRVDPHRMGQVLDNLISNAVKFSRSGTTVKVRTVHRDGEVVLSVRDQGQGIPAGELERLFRPFGKTSVRGTAGEKSTGLGLAIVKKITEEQGGRVSVQSRVGEGTDLSITIPVGERKG